MAETKQITDVELKDQIQSSYLDANQKKELVDLAEEMTADERSELLKLIDEANKAGKERDEKIAALNEEYEEKLGTTAREESEYVREEFEKFDTKQSEGELKDIEGKIDSMKPPTTKVKTERIKVAQKETHTLRNAMITIIGLVIVTAVILLILSLI